MAGLRFTDLQSRPMEFLDCTSVTLDEFQQLVPPFETAFHARMAAWRMDGKPRTARRFPVYKSCPLSTPEDPSSAPRTLLNKPHVIAAIERTTPSKMSCSSMRSSSSSC